MLMVKSLNVVDSFRPLLVPFPVFPDKFQTRVELNMAGQNVGSDIHEFYDYNARKAAIVIREKSVEYRIIFDYENDEINVYDCELLGRFKAVSESTAAPFEALFQTIRLRWVAGSCQNQQLLFAKRTRSAVAHSTLTWSALK